MLNIAFTPKGHIEERKRKKYKILKFLICFLFIFNICCLDFIIWKKYKIKCVENKIKDCSLYIEKTSKKKVLNNEESLKSLEKVIKKFPNYIGAKSISIKGRKINLKLDANEKDSCLELIKILDQSGSFSLNNVTLNENESTNRCFDIEMEDKN